MIASIAKGTVLGAANVFAVGYGLGTLVDSYGGGRELQSLVLQLGIVPGLVTGAVLGAIAWRLTSCRRIVLVGLAMTAVLALGLSLEPHLIAFGWVSTVPLALLLESWTRPRGVDPMREMASAAKGAIAGVCNAAATAAVLGTLVMLAPSTNLWFSGLPSHSSYGLLRGPDAALELGLGIGVVGAFPALAIGACIGWVADAMADWPGWARLVVIATYAVTAVALLGEVAEQQVFILPACVPALAMAVALERWTRGASALAHARACQATAPRV